MPCARQPADEEYSNLSMTAEDCIMGMFDSVMVPCPRCGAEEAVQSKAGPCLLRTYRVCDAPSDVIVDISDDIINCCGCGQRFMLKSCVTTKMMIVPTLTRGVEILVDE